MKKVFYIIGALLLLYLSYAAIKSIINRRESKEIIKTQQKAIDSLNNSTIKYVDVIEGLKDSVVVKDKEIEVLEKSQEKLREESQKYKKKISELDKILPEGDKEKIEVLTEMVVAYKGKSEADEATIKNLDSIVSKQAVQISIYSNIIFNKDQIISNKDQIIKKQKNIIYQVKADNKKLKRQKVINTIRDVAIGVVVGAGVSSL